jgi:hypothetical protein
MSNVVEDEGAMTEDAMGEVDMLQSFVELNELEMGAEEHGILHPLHIDTLPARVHDGVVGHRFEADGDDSVLGFVHLAPPKRLER